MSGFSRFSSSWSRKKSRQESKLLLFLLYEYKIPQQHSAVWIRPLNFWNLWLISTFVAVCFLRRTFQFEILTSRYVPFSHNIPVTESTLVLAMKHQNMSYYKDSLIEKVGGQRYYDFAVINHCELIRKDPRVNFFFAHLDLRGLILLQKEFLDGAFLVLSQQDTTILLGYLLKKYQLLWQMGINEECFNILKTHFVAALRDCWIDESLVPLFEKHYESLRPLFQQKVKLSSYEDIEHQATLNRITSSQQAHRRLKRTSPTYGRRRT